jgi:glycosyltransferase involved in cell wall biosynthesis
VASPLVSVVIPTRGRPQFLPQAIGSALEGADVPLEVIVVPNGPDLSWREIARAYANDGRVRFAPIDIEHANAARNEGLRLAQGSFVRFLDDDDCLVSRGASLQYSVVLSNDVDICTGSVDFVDADGRRFGGFTPEGCDFVEELFLQLGSTLPVAHVFRREFLQGMRWDICRPYLQDVDWMHSLARRGEVRWRPLRELVGTWRHHPEQRLSQQYVRSQPDTARRMAAEILLGSIKTLDESGRFSLQRRKAAAKALWDYAPESFVYSPSYWSRVALQARRLDNSSRPNQFFYHRGMWRLLNPIAAEWLMLPARVLNQKLKVLGRYHAKAT